MHKNTKRFSRLEEEDEFDNPNLLNQNAGSHKHSKGPKHHYQEGMPVKARPGMNVGEPDQLAQHLTPPSGLVEEVQDNRFNFSIYEIAMLVFFILFVANVFTGKGKNERYAQKWYASNYYFFEENYAHIGVGTEYNTKSGTPML